MEESQKKAIMVVVIVACLAVAGVIAFKNFSGGSLSASAISKGELMWVKCSNPKCNAEYEMSKRDYYSYVEKNQQGMTIPPMKCKQCGEESIYRAVKCPKCGVVFFYPSDVGGYKDQCPKCGYSKMKEEREKASGGGATGGKTGGAGGE